MYNNESLNRFNMIRVSFEMEQTERDNQLLRQQNIYSQLALKRQQIIRNLSIMISAIVIVFAVFLFLMYYSKKKKNILLAQRNNLITSQKAELDKLYLEQFKLNEIKNKFFSIIAHDLKSPFQSLLGFSELLSEEYEHFTDKQRIDAIRNIYKVTTDTYQLIENLLEWGRIQTGSHNAFPKVINMQDIVNEVLPVMDIPLKNKDLKLETDIPPFLLANADPNMISAVLRNLISNAIKFSNPGDIIGIKGSMKDNMVTLAIIDRGIGMAHDVIDKLFTFNPKVRRMGTKGETGTGMGLGLCHEFMGLNNGVIKVESKLGQGSTFTMFMQAASQIHAFEEEVEKSTSILS
jgi:signal transduction histidine kinase